MNPNKELKRLIELQDVLNRISIEIMEEIRDGKIPLEHLAMAERMFEKQKQLVLSIDIKGNPINMNRTKNS